MKNVRLLIMLSLLFAPGARTYSSPQGQATLSFEVATIKPTRSQGGIIGGGCHGVDSKYSAAAASSAPPLGRCIYSRVALKNLILLAYRESADKSLTITGGDPWTASDAYDVEAKVEDPANTTQAQLQLMLQTLLRDRFKLQFHHETHEEQGLALLCAPNGPKLKDATGEELKPGVLNQAPMGGWVIVPDGADRVMRARSVGIASIATLASSVMHLTVQDKTGLTGKYDITLNWSATPTELLGTSGTPSTDPAGPSFTTALQEQLGLRLESQKVSVGVFVIDHAERPVID